MTVCLWMWVVDFALVAKGDQGREQGNFGPNCLLNLLIILIFNSESL